MKTIVRLVLLGIWAAMVLPQVLELDRPNRRPLPPDHAEPRERRPVPQSDFGGQAAFPSVPAPPRQGAVLPGPTPGDLQVEVRGGPSRDSNSSGTGFSIHESGVWMTAQHVVAGCRRLGVETRGRFRPARLLASHRNADLAILTTQTGAPPIPMATDRLIVGQGGYGIGFPQFEKGIVNGSLIARGRMRARGFGIDGAPTLRWQENWRRPAENDSLGGMSGGPMLNARGEVIGVAVAESRRRRRVTTAAPISLREMIAQVGNQIPSDSGRVGRRSAIPSNRVDRAAEAYWASDAISRIYCQNQQRRQRRPLSRL